MDVIYKNNEIPKTDVKLFKLFTSFIVHNTIIVRQNIFVLELQLKLTRAFMNVNHLTSCHCAVIIK